MPPVGFEPTISADERPQTHALDRAATETGEVFYYSTIMFHKFHLIVVLFPAESQIFLIFRESGPPMGPPRLIFNGTERLCIKLTTTDLNLMPKLRMSESMEYLHSPPICLHCVYRDNFTFFCRYVTAVISSAPM
jgi:hypothetical protein